jgi:bla regulator protein BlaR1
MFESIFQHLWAVSLQAGVLALLALLAERIFRNAPPSFRYWLWMLVVVRLAVPLDIPIRGLAADYIKENIGSTLFSPAVFSIAESQAAAPGSTPLTIVGILWLSGVVCMLGFAAVRIIRMHLLLTEIKPTDRSELRLKTRELAVKSGIRKPIEVCISRSKSLHAPAVTGIIRPRIVIPEELATWHIEILEPVLLHELAHVRRNDLLVSWIMTLVQAFYFFHPFAWLANSRIQKAREEICDDAAVAFLGLERERYSRSMVRMGEEILKRQQSRFAVVCFSESRSNLGERIRRIMDEKYTPRCRLRAGAALAFCTILVFGVVLACNHSSDNAVNENETRKAADSKTASYPQVIRVGSGKGIVEGSDHLDLNGKALVRGTDYRIDYKTGEITLLNKETQLSELL